MIRMPVPVSLPLVAACLGAAYGKGAEFVAGLGCLVALVAMARGYFVRPGRATTWVIGVFALYFCFFVAHGAIVTHDLAGAFLSMHNNLPVLLATILCVDAGRESRWLNGILIGRTATWATIIISVLAIILYIYVSRHPDSPQVLSETVYRGRFRFHARNALMFASQLTGISFVALVGHAQRGRLDRLLAEFACILGLLVVLLLAEARGAFVTALFMAIAALWYIRPSVEFLRVKLFCILGIAIIAVGLVFLTGHSSELVSRFTSLVEAADATPSEKGSIGDRLAMYGAGWQAFLQHPFIGYGYENRFDAAAPFFPKGRAIQYEHLHNDYISHMVAGGLPGLIVFLLFSTAPLAILALTRHRSRSAIYICSVATILMAGIAASTAILGHDVHSTYFSLLIVVALTLTLHDSRSKEAGGHAVSGT